MSDLNIYNTLTRKKEKFVPLHEGFVGIYVCGPTVYSHAHLGHAKSYVSYDVIVRYLRYLGYKVRYVQNITDVGHLVGDGDSGEDKIQKQAKLEKIEPMEVVEEYTRSYFEDMDALGVIRPDISPRASGHIIEQIAMIRKLIAKGHAYEVGGNVYFDVSTFEGYGKLSGRKPDELLAGVRVEVQSDKRNPNDFALWKKAGPEHLMHWESPWGEGYPGWHIECSCMSTKYLGETFDIHGGGLENVFPHHECEIAQSEATTNKPFARYWIHNNMITVDGVKMGKSLGNFILLKDALKKYHPLAIRYFILTSHYRSAIDFSDQALHAAEKGFQRVQSGLKRLTATYENATDQGSVSLSTAAFKQAFEAAMNDDFNTAQAIAALFDYLTEINKALDSGQAVSKTECQNALDTIRACAGDVLGIVGDLTADSGSGDLLNNVMNVVLETRQQLRKKKDFELSDFLRDRLSEAGVVIKDTPDGSKWESQ